MNELILYIVIFITVYIIDLMTALLHRKMRPNNFKRVEANTRFRKCIEQRGVLKGVCVYLFLSTTESIILFLSVGFAARIIFDATIIRGLTFTFLFLAIVHVLGTITNLLALFKKDKVPHSISRNEVLERQLKEDRQ